MVTVRCQPGLRSFEILSELDVYGGWLTCPAVGASCQLGAQLGLSKGTDVWSLFSQYGSWFLIGREQKLPGQLVATPAAGTLSLLPYSVDRAEHSQGPPRCKVDHVLGG